MRAILLLALVVAGSAHSADPDAVARREIAHLIEHLASSGCQFNRNGTWHEAPRAASQSSVSGKPYLVKCGSQSEIPSAEWFRAALEKYRAASSVPQAKDL